MKNDQQLPSILHVDQGFGLLSARALWAALVGPHMLPMASIKTVQLNGDPKELKKSLGASDGYVFVGLALPPGEEDRGIFLGPGDNLGTGSWPVVLTPGTANEFPVTALILPGNQLYAQTQDGSEFPILVAAAIF